MRSYRETRDEEEHLRGRLLFIDFGYGYVIASLFGVVVFGISGQLLAFFRAGSTADWLAQLGERQSAEQEVEVSNPGRTKIRGLEKTEKKVLPL